MFRPSNRKLWSYFYRTSSKTFAQVLSIPLIYSFSLQISQSISFLQPTKTQVQASNILPKMMSTTGSTSHSSVSTMACNNPQETMPIKKSRGIEKIVTAKKQREGGGFVVRRPIGGQEVSYASPFLMLDHLGPVEYAPGEAVGAPDHPHRGFETVTYVLEGGFHHKDSKGNEGNLNSGWCQWMTAGSGVIHSEMPTDELLEKGGRMEGFQLWVNLPAKDKMIPPRYQDTPPENIPVVTSEDNKVTVKVIAGKSMNTTSPIETRTPMYFLDIRLQPGASFAQPVPESFNGFAYMYRGNARFGVDKTLVKEGQALIMSEGNTLDISINSDDEEGRLLLIAGVPIDEPIARYGPFVMNTEAEIRKCFQDFQDGTFGEIEGAEERRQKTDQAVRAQKGSGTWQQGNKEL